MSRLSARLQRQVIGPFTLRHLVVLLGVLVAAAVALVLLTTPLRAPRPVAQAPGSDFYQTGDPTAGLAVGQPAPELEGFVDGQTVSLTDLDGQPVTLAALHGRPVWLNFFATWCPPCQEETPVLRDMYETYRDQGLQLVAISVQETTPQDVADWAATYSLPFPIGFDATGAVFETYLGYGLPTQVFIDADGIIRELRYGPLDRDTAASIIEPLLATSRPG
jgi:peroxiredoxin